MSIWRRVWDRRRHDSGVSLVEIMVSVTVLAITMAAVASGTVRSLQVAAESRDSVLAANVAQFELERLRSIPFVDWVVTAREDGGNSTTIGPLPVTLDSGQTYEITREAVWVQSGADVDGCTAAVEGQDGSDYVRVTQIIEFPGRDIDPVVNTTIITPRLDFYDPDTGNLAVVVRDRDGVGAAGHTVRIQGLAGTEVATTDSNGCAFFPFLRIDPDDPANNGYDLEIDSPGHIDLETQLLTIDDLIYVGAQQTQVKEYQYPEYSSYTVVPTLPQTPLVPAAGDRRPANDCVMVVQGDELVCLDTNGDRVPVLADGSRWAAQIPQDLGYGFTNGNLGHLAFPSGPADDDPLVDVRPDVVEPLYPYSAGYEAHAGRCTVSAPQQTGAVDGFVVAAEPGVLADVDLEVATTTIYTGDVTGPNVTTTPGQDVWAEMIDSDECLDGDRMYVGRTGSDGRLITVLPFGTWYLWTAPPGGAGDVAAPPAALSTCDPTATGLPGAPGDQCYEIRADYDTVQTPLGIACAGSSVLVIDGALTLTTTCGTTANTTYGYTVVLDTGP